MLPLGPAALVGLKAGDYILQIDGRSTAPPANVDELLDHTIGKRIALSVQGNESISAARARVMQARPRS